MVRWLLPLLSLARAGRPAASADAKRCGTPGKTVAKLGATRVFAKHHSYYACQRGRTRFLWSGRHTPTRRSRSATRASPAASSRSSTTTARCRTATTWRRSCAWTCAAGAPTARRRCSAAPAARAAARDQPGPGARRGRRVDGGARRGGRAARGARAVAGEFDGLPTVLSIDLGTGGPKVALVALADGRVLDRESEPVGLRVLPGGGVEQSPVQWWRATAAAVPPPGRPRRWRRASRRSPSPPSGRGPFRSARTARRSATPSSGWTRGGRHSSGARPAARSAWPATGRCAWPAGCAAPAARRR